MDAMEVVLYVTSTEFVISLAASIVITSSISIYMVIKNKSSLVLAALRYVWYSLRKKKRILFWCDDIAVTDAWKNVYHSGEKKGYSLITIDETRKVLRYPLSLIDIVVLVNTNVSQISSRHNESELIQNRLKKYAQKGGQLILTHDIAWRRSRAKILCEAMKYKTDHFEKPDVDKITVNYVAKDLDCPLVKKFGDFKLKDGEVCWGGFHETWCHRILYETEVFDRIENERKTVPVMIYHKIRDGYIIWMNSGDKPLEEVSCDSLINPTKLYNIIEYIGTEKEMLDWSNGISHCVCDD